MIVKCVWYGPIQLIICIEVSSTSVAVVQVCTRFREPFRFGFHRCCAGPTASLRRRRCVWRFSVTRLRLLFAMHPDVLARRSLCGFRMKCGSFGGWIDLVQVEGFPVCLPFIPSACLIPKSPIRRSESTAEPGLRRSPPTRIRSTRHATAAHLPSNQTRIIQRMKPWPSPRPGVWVVKGGSPGCSGAKLGCPLLREGQSP
jgi:hypothetical protein